MQGFCIVGVWPAAHGCGCVCPPPPVEPPPLQAMGFALQAWAISCGVDTSCPPTVHGRVGMPPLKLQTGA
jgi:hypothetical protein